MIEGLKQRLQAERKKHRLSQKDVAIALGTSASIISGYETGERSPSLENLIALSKLYNCSTDYLLGKEESSSKTIDVSNLTSLQAQCLSAFICSLTD